MTAATVGAPRWLHRLRDTAAGAADRLVVFPAAGANASSAHDLVAAVPDGWAVWSVQYPGRGPRLREAPAGSVREVAAACLPAVLAGPGRTVLFGHSFGAIVAYDLARLMEAHGRPAAGLIVAGSSALGLATTGTSTGAGPGAGAGTGAGVPDVRSDEALVEFLGGRGGTPPHLLADPELMALTVAALRTDLTLAADHTDDHPGRLGTGVLALGGRSDPAVTAAQLSTWQDRTDAWLGLELTEGGHFFHRDDPALIGRVLHRHWPPERTTRAVCEGASRCCAP